MGVRRGFQAGIERLRINGWSVVQTAVAASVAYILAVVLFGHEQPFFAPVAAVICLGVTLGQRWQRAVERFALTAWLDRHERLFNELLEAQA